MVATLKYSSRLTGGLRAAFVGCALASGITLGAVASAQSVSPMEKQIKTFTDKFVVQVTIANPYPSGQVSELYLRSAEWEAIPGAVLSHRRAFLGGGKRLTVTALIPFEHNQTKRYVYLCHAITPKTGGQGAAYRGEVCGKYSAIKLS